MVISESLRRSPLSFLISHSELQLNKANSFDAGIPFRIWACSLPMKSFHFKFTVDKLIVNFLLLGGDDPRSPSYGVFNLQLICFTILCSNVSVFNDKNYFFDY